MTSSEDSAFPTVQKAVKRRWKRTLLYLARRLVVMALLLLILSLAIFALLALSPGSTLQALLAGRPASPTLVHELSRQYGLGQPFLTQYWIWLRHALELNLGRSVRTGTAVTAAIASSAGVTVLLAFYAFVIAVAVGVPLGVTAALKKMSMTDSGIVAVTVIGISSPVFATGLVLLYIFGIRLGWFPIYGVGSGFWSELYHLTLPALALALSAMALLVKFTRAGMIQALSGDYIVFATVRGISRRRVLFGYAFRNALVPVLTASGLILTYMLTGTVLTEATFSLPGLGSLLVDAISFKDVPTVQGIALLIAVLVVVVNLVVDLLYSVVDPRIQLGRPRS